MLPSSWWLWQPDASAIAVIKPSGSVVASSNMPPSCRTITRSSDHAKGDESGKRWNVTQVAVPCRTGMQR